MLVIEKLELVGMVIVLEAPVALLSGMLKPVPVPVKVTALAGRTVSTAIALTVPAKTTPKPDRDLKVVVVFMSNFEKILPKPYPPPILSNITFLSIL
jgi:hypothetical protein